MKVSNFHNKNQFIIWNNNKLMFQSYESLIAEIDYNLAIYELTLGVNWDYSKTTMKHLKMFLNEYEWYGKYRIDWKKPFKQQIEKLISEGVIIKTW